MTQVGERGGEVQVNDAGRREGRRGWTRNILHSILSQ